MIYLDYQATTPLAPEAREAMLRWLDGPDGTGFGNPHSSHRMGRQAEAAVEVARERVAALFPPGGRVVFTGSATEALNLALRGCEPGRTGRPVAVSAIEHSAVLDTALDLPGDTTILPVDRDGLVDPQVALPVGVGIVSVMLLWRGHNEPGGGFSIHNQTLVYAPFERYAGISIPEGGQWGGSLETGQNHVFSMVSLNPDGKPTKTQNMALTEKINEDIKAAMRAKDKRSLEALRAIKSALMLEATKADKSETTEADEMKLLTRLLKQRKDSEQIYREQQRDDLADEEAFQASVIGNYLPESLAPEEIEKIVLEIINSTGATGMKDMGRVMGAANAKMAGRADGKVIADLVKAKLGGA